MGFFLKSIIDFIFPSICYICKTPFNSEKEIGICPHCLSQMKYIESPLCSRCGKPFYSEMLTDHLCGDCLTGKRYFSRARAVGYYDGILRQAIHLLKYKLKNDLALPLGNLMANRMQSFLNDVSYHLIIPVPLHPKRLRERGFNQALSLARFISKRYKIPLDSATLIRRRQTKPQVSLSERDRQDNVKGAFSVLRSDKVPDRDILLVDDVYTSGNTVVECSKVLIKAGAHKVDVLTLARVS
jgi:ComF family protein